MVPKELDGAVSGGGGADRRLPYTPLPLDDCLFALQAASPHLTRSSLHRLFQRQGISRLPIVEGDNPKKRFEEYPIGYVHIDIAEVRTEDGKLHMFVAIDRVTKFAFAELHERATRRAAAEFLRPLIEAVPYKIHTVLIEQRYPVHNARQRALGRNQGRRTVPSPCL